MTRAALTGGIATGKSFCLSRFAALGVPVVDADLLARAVVEPGSDGLAAVAAQFGPDVLRGDGSLDRARLGEVVFASSAARAELEAIVHPRVYRRIDAWFANLPAGVRCGLADIPLLFETGHQHDFGTVVVSACDPELQFRRLMSRDGLSADGARARLAAQWPIEEKVKRADYVIRTDGTFAETEAQVRAVFEALCAER